MRLDSFNARILFVLGLLFTFAVDKSAYPADVTAVYGVIATDPVYLWVAQEKGFFKKNGVDVNLTHIPTNQAVQALIGGKVQFVTAGPQILEAALAGSDTVYIMGPINSFVLSLYSKPEINGIRGLAGKPSAPRTRGLRAISRVTWC